MNNADMPAMPFTTEWQADNQGWAANTGYKVTASLGQGLTKREHFAGLALQGFIANNEAVQSTEGERMVDFIATCSVAYADALLAKLDKSGA